MIELGPRRVARPQRSKCGLTRSILRNPSGLARPGDWDSELHCADVNSFRRFLPGSQYQRSYAKLSVWSTIDSLEDFAFDIIQNFCWLMNAMFRPKLKRGRFGTSSFLHPRWYGATDRYILEFCMRQKFDKCIWAWKNWLLPKIVDIMPVEAHEIFYRELQPFER